MISKPLVAAFLAAGCVGAAAGGAYVAVRQNAVEQSQTRLTVEPAPSQTPAGTPATSVAETEAVVAPKPEAEVETRTEEPSKAEPAPRPRPFERAQKPERPARRVRHEATVPPGRRSPTTPVARRPAAAEQNPADTGASAAPVERIEPPAAALPEVPPPPPAAPEPQFVQVVLPASSVIGLHVETSLSSERARIEDRVDARVTRDVSAGGRVAIPAGSRVIGSVTLVERGGKVKERARLGVRFHTLVFADGTEVPIRTDAIYREGESPGGESARKIGGATVGGAILGAILGGGKGAAIGGAAGAAGGTAAVMAGDRNPASLPAGTIVTVRLSEPLSIDVEKRNQ